MSFQISLPIITSYLKYVRTILVVFMQDPMRLIISFFFISTIQALLFDDSYYSTKLNDSVDWLFMSFRDVTRGVIRKLDDAEVKRFVKNAQLTRSVISGFGRCSQRAGAEIGIGPIPDMFAICKTLTGLPCLPSTETLAQQDVDVKNRQRVLDGLTAEKRVGTITVVLKRIIWGNQDCLIR